MTLLRGLGCCLHHAGIIPWTHPGCWSPSALSFWQCCQLQLCPSRWRSCKERAEPALCLLCRESEQKEPSFPSKYCPSRLHEHYGLHTRQKAKAPFLGVAVATALQRFLCSPCRAGWRVQALEGHLWLQERFLWLQLNPKKSPGHWESRGNYSS